MKKIFFFILTLLLLSCSKKNVKLPIVGLSGIKEVYNTTNVWIFFKTKNADTLAILNKNNIISTTNWIYNIDKRLSLKKVIPLVQKMQIKHSKKTIHSIDGVYDYYSYADTINKNYSFIKFDNKFIFDRPYFKVDKEKKPINLKIYKNFFYLNNVRVKNDFLSQKIDSISKENHPNTINLAFHSDVTFQKYIYFKIIIEKLKTQLTTINKKEFIFD